MNVTDPEGAPLPGGAAATVAVNVTALPRTEGFFVEVTAVMLASLFTVCVINLKLGVKFASPLYSARIEWFPTAAAAENASVATPPITGLVPMGK
jgi:hypothetical protein